MTRLFCYSAGAVAANAVADVIEGPSSLIDVDDLAWDLALIAAPRFGRLRVAHRFNPRRRSILLTVAGEPLNKPAPNLLVCVAISPRYLDGGARDRWSFTWQ
ncbi:hypothetical protein ACFIOY_18810 [Bradyrhizobium sp. TZ2]